MLDRKDFSQLIGEIYDAALDSGRWPYVLGRLAHAFGGSSAHLSTEDFAMTEGELISFGTDPAYARRYAEYYVTRNVLWQRLMRRPFHEITTSRIVMPMEELCRTEFYNDFLRPQDGEEILVSVLLPQSDRATCLTLWRPERLAAWDNDERHALAALAPHLRRVLVVNRSLGRAAATSGPMYLHEASCFEQAVEWLSQPIILADADARVRFANRAARTLLASRDGLRSDQDGLSADRPRLTPALRSLIARAVAAPTEAGGGGMLALARASLKRPLSVLVSSLPNLDGAPFTSVPVVLVLVTDPERSPALSPDYLRQLYGLTRMEAAVAVAVAEGQSRKAIGEKLGMAQPTIGSHLAQIFRKTGTSRQAELVRLLLQSRIDVLDA